MGDFLSNIVELKDFVKRGQEKCGEIRGGGCMYFEFWGIWQKLINFGMGLCFNIAPRQERYKSLSCLSGSWHWFQSTLPSGDDS